MDGKMIKEVTINLPNNIINVTIEQYKNKKKLVPKRQHIFLNAQIQEICRKSYLQNIKSFQITATVQQAATIYFNNMCWEISGIYFAF
jgi:site-specific recombinase XerD